MLLIPFFEKIEFYACLRKGYAYHKTHEVTHRLWLIKKSKLVSLKGTYLSSTSYNKTLSTLKGNEEYSKIKWFVGLALGF